MADFTRFISYLYDYRGGERSRNLGFAKVESRQGMCRLSVCLNQGQVLRQNMLVCGYTEDENLVQLICLGEMEQGTREHRWSLPADNLGGAGVRLEQLSGLILVTMDRTFFLLSIWNDSRWTAQEICRAEIWNGRKPGRTEKNGSFAGQENSTAVPNGNSEEKKETETQREMSVRTKAEIKNESENPNKEEHPLEARTGETKTAESPEHLLPDTWRSLCRLFPAARPFEPSVWEVLCISLQDIGRLPPENWSWGSNHFLLHGFYQYHHLILARNRVENRVYLGVPGEFGVNEKFMAAMFGLHQFQRERKGRSDKGYWLTPVRL